jgi:hypothetical protein
VSGGNVIVSTAESRIGPLMSDRSARQGPRGRTESSCTVTGSETPDAMTVPNLAAKGPARSPSGPFESARLPLMSSVLWPLLWTVAATNRSPDFERPAVSGPMVKLEDGPPPGPIER